jgi:hypothetical protein
VHRLRRTLLSTLDRPLCCTSRSCRRPPPGHGRSTTTRPPREVLAPDVVEPEVDTVAGPAPLTGPRTSRSCSSKAASNPRSSTTWRTCAGEAASWARRLNPIGQARPAAARLRRCVRSRRRRFPPSSIAAICWSWASLMRSGTSEALASIFVASNGDSAQRPQRATAAIPRTPRLALSRGGDRNRAILRWSGNSPTASTRRRPSSTAKPGLVELVDHIQHEHHKMIGRRPIAHVRRHQERLLPITKPNWGHISTCPGDQQSPWPTPHQPSCSSPVGVNVGGHRHYSGLSEIARPGIANDAPCLGHKPSPRGNGSGVMSSCRSQYFTYAR